MIEHLEIGRDYVLAEHTNDSNTRTMEEEWTFDNTGNWATYKHDPDGGGWSLAQTRTHNKANEVGVIGATVGANWVDPVHDKAGNMTTMPLGSDPTASRACVYDAWNRLIEWMGPSDTGSRFGYDGLNRRVKAERLVNDAVVETRHYYYSAGWQVLEERLGTTPNSADAERQFVWGLRYVDDLILRDRDAGTSPDGVLEERLYALQDPNWNVTAICESDGDVVERYVYSAYGVCTLLDDQYATRSTSSYAWETMYAGYRHDAATGLYCVRNRYLHAGLGRWLFRDASGYADGHNLYCYVSNDAVASVDAFGLFKIQRSQYSQFADAVSEDGDTISDLAKSIGLDEREWRKWLTHSRFIDAKATSGQKFSMDTRDFEYYYYAHLVKLCAGNEFRIPNTINALWLGDWGPVGRFAVGWGGPTRPPEKHWILRQRNYTRHFNFCTF